ncbi:MAG: acyl-CoA dehydrogenase family protein, partial [bacterium]
IILTLTYAEAEAVEKPELFQVEAKAAGDDYIINGTKLFVANANVANSMIVAAKTDKGITLFLVDAKSAGVNIVPLSTMTQDKQSEVNFKDVKVSKENIIGEVNKGGEVLGKILGKAAIAKCAELLGGCNYVLESTIAYSKERVQFGKPIGSFQAIQHHCANMAIDVEGSRFLIMEAAWMIDKGLPCTREISVTKAFVNGACYKIVMLGHQVHGALAFQQEHDMHLYIKQAKLGEITYGSSSYHKEVVAKAIGL